MNGTAFCVVLLITGGFLFNFLFTAIFWTFYLDLHLLNTIWMYID